MRQRVLGVTALALINVAAIISLRNLPLMAQYGLSSVFFYTFAGLLYLIPTGLVCAELATGWPGEGGVYHWVSEAFGKRAGFITMWFTWMESIAWFPAILSFTAITLAYIIKPELAQSKSFMVTVILTVFWGSTIINFLGIKTSAKISSLGVLIGTLIPGALIILLGFWWYFTGHELAIDISRDALVPELHFDNMVFFSGVLLGFAGMELAAYHAMEAKNPQRDYPRAMFYSALLILSVSILGSLAIAFVVPANAIGLVEGLMQAFQAFFNALHLGWLTPIIAVLAFVGPLAGINTWIAGPVKGILPAARDGFLGKLWRYENNNGVAVSLLVLQASIGSILALIFLFMPNVNTAYWILTAVSAQFTLLMYSMVFLSALKLRYTQPEVVRAYRIPGMANIGMWFVAGVGVITCIFSFVLAFVPPKGLEIGAFWSYEGSLILAFAILAIPPFYLAYRYKRQQSISIS